MDFMFIIMGDVDDDIGTRENCIFDIIPDDDAENAYYFRDMSELYKASILYNKNLIPMKKYLETHPYPECLRRKLWS